MTTIEFAADGYPVDAIRETPESTKAACGQLAQMITAHCVESGDGFDRIIYIPRGGLYVANEVGRELQFEAYEMWAFAEGAYTGTERGDDPTRGQVPLQEDVEGLDLLVLDEVCDTGSALARVHKFLTGLGAASVKVGVLDYKPTRSLTGYVPTWHVRETDKWIVYPWEHAEARGRSNHAVNKRFRRPSPQPEA